ncbi:glycosyltransferase family 4 protein [Vagococcus fluvialis]|uniref:glycosyltransferase family 4 protein n=1 Tax=Vagococcus fluvialis TaxID=2738 RepID=UPI0037B94FD6
MKKALIVSSVASMIDQFNMDNIKLLKELGYEVHVGTNFDNPGTISMEKSKNLIEILNSQGVQTFQINFSRSPFDLKNNRVAFSDLKELSKKENYDLVHLHSPIGGVLGRLVFNKKKTKIIYTAHGFHFFKGGKLKDWLLFYPIEYLLSKNTSILITINKNDYEIAKGFKGKLEVKQIPGVGIDFDRFNKSITNKISKDDFIIVSVGELNDNKNHIAGIEAIKLLKHLNGIKYIICGVGPKKGEIMNKITEYELSEKVELVGYSDSVEKYYKNASLFLFPSKREGLGLASLEAMASGLPLVNTNVGGMKDYTINGVTGFVFSDPENYEQIAKAIEKIYRLNNDEIQQISKNNTEIASKYSIEIVHELMKEIYLKCCQERK